MNSHCPSDGPRNCKPSGRLYSFIYILHGMVVYGPHEKGPESRIHVLSTMGSSHRWCPQKPRCSMVFRFTQEMKDCLRVQGPTNGRNGISSNCICCASWILLVVWDARITLAKECSTAFPFAGPYIILHLPSSHVSKLYSLAVSSRLGD